MESSEKPDPGPAFEQFSQEWMNWLMKKHIDAVNQLQSLANGFKVFGDVGKAAAVEFENVIKTLNQEVPRKKEDE
uniref:Tail assembly chaperone n=1 Tax=Micrococcus phage Kurnik TaxID=3092208 RepID=A0AAU6R691_9CAUD